MPPEAPAGHRGAAGLRILLYAAVAALLGGCIPIGAKWQNMFAALLG